MKSKNKVNRDREASKKKNDDIDPEKGLEKEF